MNTLNIIALILVTLIFIITLLIILFKHYNEKIVYISSKINDAQNDLLKETQNEHSVLIKLIDIIENKYKIESKTFDEVKSLNIKQITITNNDKLFSKCFNEIKDAKEDNTKKKGRELKSYVDNKNKYEECELHIISLRTYYNKYVLEFNNLIKKFPYNLVSITKKYKLKILIEGQEIDNSFNNNLEV